MIRTKLYLDARRAKHQDHECAVRINITKDRKTAVIPAGLVIAVKYWNPQTSQVENHPQANMLNNVLSKRKIDVDGIIVRLEDDKKAETMSVTEIRDYVVSELQRRDETLTGKKKEVKAKPKPAPKPEDSPQNLKRLFEAFKGMHERKSTREKYDGTWKRIKKWYEELKKDATTLQAGEITLQWLENFDKFLKKTSPSADARGIHFRNLKAVLNYAIKHDIIDKWKTQARMTPGAKVDLTPENNLFLTPEEFGRRGQFYFGLSAFEGFEFTDAFAGECDTVCGVDDAVEDGIRHCGVADGVVPVQFGEL